MTFLALALCFEAILLMRRGMRPLGAQISGSSMEPHLMGPRFLFQNTSSQFFSSYTLDSLRPNMPLVCQYTSERDNSFDMLSAMANPEAMNDGESVRYYLWKRMAALRAAKNSDRPNETNENAFQGIERGDLVVIQPPDEESREVKRIVGFPDESIEIIDGDLWVNDRRWKRTFNQILHHAVLLDYGDAQFGTYWNYGEWISTKQTVDAEEAASSRSRETLDFRLRSGGLITNELRWNAHDSHSLIPVPDIGFALELENTPSDWQLAVTIRSQYSSTIMVERIGDTIIVSTDQKEVSKTISTDLKNHWLLFMKVDGETIVADESSDWLRETNANTPNPEDESSLELDAAPFSIECHEGDFRITQWMVFRDLHYRGTGDTSRQRLPASKGVVVLGDNVSISDDSRQRWNEELPTEAIRGVVDLGYQGWEALLKQKSKALFERNSDLLKDKK
ncbi:MAG: S26 family signal peptidase [Pirellula sp.]|jgi:signal peptidase I